uniref:Galectin n=1 Tax=Caenorhabditis tropicalis TaxID=1561998 RepID=A0A1I7TQZ9_9PELO
MAGGEKKEEEKKDEAKKEEEKKEEKKDEDPKKETSMKPFPNTIGLDGSGRSVPDSVSLSYFTAGGSDLTVRCVGDPFFLLQMSNVIVRHINPDSDHKIDAKSLQFI